MIFFIIVNESNDCKLKRLFVELGSLRNNIRLQLIVFVIHIYCMVQSELLL